VKNGEKVAEVEITTTSSYGGKMTTMVAKSVDVSSPPYLS